MKRRPAGGSASLNARKKATRARLERARKTLFSVLNNGLITQLFFYDIEHIEVASLSIYKTIGVSRLPLGGNVGLALSASPARTFALWIHPF